MLQAVDRQNPSHAHTARLQYTPSWFGKKARKALQYLDDTCFIFKYDGNLVITDESLELTEAGDGSLGNPIGFPRAVCKSWRGVEDYLNEVYEENCLK